MQSFTLSELLVTMIITVIIVGLAFSVLNLVRKQVHAIEVNYSKRSEATFFKQSIWLDFNRSTELLFNRNDKRLWLKSETDSVSYTFQDDYVLRNKDTLKIALQIEKLWFMGKNTEEGIIDAVTFTEKKEGMTSGFFVFKKNDATLFMNQDGF